MYPLNGNGSSPAVGARSEVSWWLRHAAADRDGPKQRVCSSQDFRGRGEVVTGLLYTTGGPNGSRQGTRVLQKAREEAEGKAGYKGVCEGTDLSGIPDRCLTPCA